MVLPEELFFVFFLKLVDGFFFCLFFAQVFLHPDQVVHLLPHFNLLLTHLSACLAHQTQYQYISNSLFSESCVVYDSDGIQPFLWVDVLEHADQLELDVFKLRSQRLSDLGQFISLLSQFVGFFGSLFRFLFCLPSPFDFLQKLRVHLFDFEL